VRSRDDIAPLAVRLDALHIGRAGAAAVVAATELLSPEGIAAGSVEVVGAAAILVALGAALEALRRARHLGTALIDVELGLDAIGVTLVVAYTGRATSPFLILAMLHVVAATLVLSHRTGLKLALWYVLLLTVAEAAHDAAWFTVDDPGAGSVAATIAVTLLVLGAIGTAAYSALNERELRANHALADALADLGVALQAVQGPHEVCAAAARLMVERLGFSRAVALASDGDQAIGVRAESMRDQADDVVLDDVAVGSAPFAAGLAERCLTSGGTLRVAYKQHGGDAVVDATLPDAGDLVIVALVAEDAAQGVLIGEWSRGSGTRIGRSVVAAFAQVGALTSLALRNARLREHVAWLAAHDELTSLPNRRTLDRTLERELARSIRRQSSLGLVMLDIDRFKVVNDRHGHATGDEVLAGVAAALRAAAREGDLVARFGGEEFGVVLHDIDDDHAAFDTAERLRRSACGTFGGVRVTLSAGVAVGPFDGIERLELLRAADAALYRAKESGRNRTVQFDAMAAAPRS
jgi:diguanylate cyclase (GGDEF)-like protein